MTDYMYILTMLLPMHRPERERVSEGEKERDSECESVSERVSECGDSRTAAVIAVIALSLFS